MSVNLKNPKYYFNRELSWLRFNERVLEEAEDSGHPILERLKFLSIFSSNLDEFFMIRVAGLHEQVAAGIHEFPADGLSAQGQIEEISLRNQNLVSRQSHALIEEILPNLRKNGIRLRYFSTLSTSQKEALRKYFKAQLFPVLTPLAVDPSHPFPKLRNLSLNILVELKMPYKRGDVKFAVIPVPQLLDRFIPIPGKNKHDFILIEDLIQQHLDMLFPDMKVVSSSEFRVTRNADLDLSEAEADDLLKHIERQLRKQRMGTLIRLEVSASMQPKSKEFLMEMTKLKPRDIYYIQGYLDLADFMHLLSVDIQELKDPDFTPALKENITNAKSIFSAIRQSDILLHLPFDSFGHVIELIQEAANDPDVLAIKQTLYRTSGQSPIVQALKDAVIKGKQVTALIELKARFDEATNIGWAKELESSGVNVVYGVMGLKTHCKICMIVRKEGSEIRRYLHMGTGNYNSKTAKIYTDFGLMTCDKDMGKDASELFNLLTGYSKQQSWRKFIVSPVNLRESLLKLIRACLRGHTKENPSRVRMVMNSLVDPEMIQYLYRLSMKGIKVELIIRGICCLRPGIKGVSENITVRSIVGRFLEHTRVFIFEYDNEQKIYLGSADLMQRNLNRRVELIFPVEGELLKERILRILEKQLQDNTKARILTSEGEYVRAKKESGTSWLNVQEYFLEQAFERQSTIDTITS